jgi:hypothetical protein
MNNGCTKQSVSHAVLGMSGSTSTQLSGTDPEYSDCCAYTEGDM